MLKTIYTIIDDFNHIKKYDKRAKGKPELKILKYETYYQNITTQSKDIKDNLLKLQEKYKFKKKHITLFMQMLSTIKKDFK